MQKIFLAAALLLLAAPLALAQAPAAKSESSSLSRRPQPATVRVNAGRLRAHVKFLSSDLLEGRGTGQRGGDIAADYIATQFALEGLKPVGDNGTYMQVVPMVGITTLPATTVTLLPAVGTGQPLRLGPDVIAMDESQRSLSEVDAPLVFVGYGITAPEFNWDDYKGVDVRGKVLLMLVNEPPSDDPKFFAGKALTYYGRWTYKYEEAARRGAIGAILVHKTEMASYGWNVVQTSWGGERAYLANDGLPKLSLAAWISYATVDRIAATTGASVEKLIAQAADRNFRPVTLPFRVQARVVSQIRPFRSANVLAMLPGSDPKLHERAVVYTAHFDHLGIHPDEPGDNIYHGAVDNATGCAILLEIARVFAASPLRPQRSILFAAVTGEEQGLLGSEYLGRHLPLPAAQVDLDLNFDAFAPIGIPETIEVSGAERTTFYADVKAVARQFHFTLEPDANPGAGHYYRSDHFSLARVGIPAFSVSEGLKFAGHPLQYGEDWQKQYTAKNYHQPSDTYHAEWDFRGIAKLADFSVALGRRAAALPRPIGWVAGDEFAVPRKQSAAK